ncbi:sensor histidine kinase [Propylenella binzhouense]|uniref:histidine kinase n=1 Tax=Propylenella binzhouense TaxID=2555902 RepID=A0A964T338_9HYPH|nr:PAS domain-containing sensor histidine kinase [Propylenella binzhouense]MYZ47606.1 PAS domain-containing sensor histidine kinase [Propylenella binzhouense]
MAARTTDGKPGARRRLWRPGTGAGLGAAAAVLGTSEPVLALAATPPETTAFADVLWLAVTIGSVAAAGMAFSLLSRSRGQERLAGAEERIRQLSARLDRAEVLLAADDQKTVVWDSSTASPEVLGSLPERVGAPFDRAEFLAISRWLEPESARQLEEAVQKLRRYGEGFQMAARSNTGAVLEVSGRTSGKRSILRFRELTGERRTFAELKEQAAIIIKEVTALRTLADALPFPLWRRNRVGRLVWVNPAYVSAVEAAGAEAVVGSGIELLPTRARDGVREAHRAARSYNDSVTAIVAGERRRLQVYDILIDDGSIGCALDLSEVDVAKDELRRVTESNARTLDHLAAGIASFDSQGRLLFYNEAYRALWGFAAKWLDSKPEESAILDHLRAERKLPEQANYREWRTKHLAAYQAIEPREDWWHLPDGRTLRMVATPNAEGGITYIFENVTQQLSLESRVNALSQLQGETLDHLTEGVAVFGTDGRLRLFNPVFAEIWRLSPAQLDAEPHIGEIIRDCSAIYSDEPTWEAIRIAVTDLEHGEPVSGRMQRPDDSVIDFATVALPEGMTMLTFVDVTDTARVQRALKERNEALEAADRLKTEFIHHVSYELRSPLTSIIGFAEMISNEAVGSLNERQREYMDHISSSSSALLAIINDILDLATVDAGIMALDLGEVDIRGVAEAAVEGLRDRIAEQKITLDIEIPERIGKFLADEQRVRQILFNLVSNAIRFSNAGGRVEVKAERRGRWVVYTVRDEGVGIPSDLLATIFRPFEAHGTSGHRHGAGLGLSVVKSLVELHHGSIDVKSEEGKGTTVVVRLPEVTEVAADAAE